MDLDLLQRGFKQLEKAQRNAAFNPQRPDLPATETQLKVLKEERPVIFCVGGNRSGKCLISQTKIATPQGAVNIEDLQPGDTVYDERGNETTVTAVKYQGRQTILPIKQNGKYIASATANHRWLTTRGKEVVTEQLLTEEHTLATTRVRPKMGTLSEPHAYALGAFLGDGCSREAGTGLSISSENGEIPAKIASLLGSDVEVIRDHKSNYTWTLRRPYTTGRFYSTPRCRHYDAWCGGRYAHEKVIDLDVVKNWNRESICALLAGLLDTDGCVRRTADNRITLTWAMQAKSVMTAVQWLVLSLWQYNKDLKVDNREKYKNGPVYEFSITTHDVAIEVLKELDHFLVTPRKKWHKEYNSLKTQKKVSQCPHRIRQNRIREADTWDIEVSNDSHLFLLANGTVSHNSQLGSRITTWWFNGNHPYQSRPASWGKGPITIMVIGRVSQQIENELFPNKIRPFLEPGTWKAQRVGNTLQYIEHLETGNRMLFFSHHNINEAREKVQAFTTHFVWLDEMADSASFINELNMRLITTGGRMIATFTPLVRSEEVRKLVDSPTDFTVKYKLSMLDNPLLKENPELLKRALSQLSIMPEAERNTRLSGDWYRGEFTVYKFDTKRDVHTPIDYSYRWRHILSVDPAMSGNTGVTVWAERPNTGVWYCMEAYYTSGMLSPAHLVDYIEKRHQHLNIVRRVADPHEVWFFGTAANAGKHYVGVHKKSERKKELIKSLQQAIDDESIKISASCRELIEEFTSCEYSESGEDRIINASRYHLLDSAQYFWDNRLKTQKIVPNVPALQHFEATIMAQHKARKAARQKARIKRSKRKGWKLKA